MVGGGLSLVAIAVGLFVFGVVMMSRARDVQATGSEGLAADSDLVAFMAR